MTIGIVVEENEDLNSNVSKTISIVNKTMKIIPAGSISTDNVIFDLSPEEHPKIIEKNYIGVLESSKFLSVSQFQDLKSNNSYIAFIKGLLEIQGVSIIIAKEIQANKSLSYLMLQHKSSSIQENMESKKRVVEFLKNNPSVSGILEEIPGKQLLKFPGRYSMGLGTVSIESTTMNDLISSMSKYQTTVPRKENKLPYPWIGFEHRRKTKQLLKLTLESKKDLPEKVDDRIEPTDPIAIGDVADETSKSENTVENDSPDVKSLIFENSFENTSLKSFIQSQFTDIDYQITKPCLNINGLVCININHFHIGFFTNSRTCDLDTLLPQLSNHYLCLVDLESNSIIACDNNPYLDYLPTNLITYSKLNY